jgi:hypothetical protein
MVEQGVVSTIVLLNNQVLMWLNVLAVGGLKDGNISRDNGIKTHCLPTHFLIS